MKKRILALFLACMMIVSVIAVPAFAEEECTHKNKSYGAILSGTKLPETCADEPVVAEWSCTCGATGTEKVVGDHKTATTTVEATCDAPYKVITACACGLKKEEVSVGEPAGHDWVLDETAEGNKDATCDKPGVAILVCARKGCDETKEEPITSIGHVWDATVYVGPTCDRASGIQYACFLCDATKVVPFEEGHELYKAPTQHTLVTDSKDATCSEPGYKDAVVCKNCDYVETEGTVVEPNENHTPELVGTPLKPADCTKGETGVGKFQCKDCKADLGYRVIPVEHDFSVVHDTKAATCGKDGYIIWKCSKGCTTGTGNNVKPVTWTEVLPASSVEHSFKLGTIPATCTEPAKAGTFCENCLTPYIDADGNSDMSVVKDSKPLGHVEVMHTSDVKDAAGKVIGKAPTCGEKGLFYLTCERCDWTNGSAKNPTSLEKAPEHDLDTTKWKYLEPTCDKPNGMSYQCKVCSKWVNKYFVEGDSVYEAPTDHSLNKAIDIAATCANPVGYKGYQDCKNCDYETWTEKITTWTVHGNEYLAETLRPMICKKGETQEGVGMYKCSTKGCGEYVAYKVIPVAHTWEEQSKTAPTCTTPGKTTSKCKNCDEIKEVTTTKNHTLKAITGDLPVIAPTCETAEKKATKVCEECKGYFELIDFKGQKPATGHKNTEVKINCLADNVDKPDADDKDGKIDGKTPVAPTCTATGWGYVVCNDCGKSIKGTQKNPVELPKLEHTYGAATYVDASCTHANGFKQTCSVCGFVYIDEFETTDSVYEAPIAHDFKDYGSKEPTCLSNGYVNYKKCKVCYLDVADKWIPKNPDKHVYVLDEENILKEATCTTPGVGQYKCTNPDCEDTEYFGQIPAKHTWSDETQISGSLNAGYVVCSVTGCGAIKVVKDYDTEDDVAVEIGKVLPGVEIAATISVSGVVRPELLKNSVILTINVTGIASDYEDIYLEVMVGANKHKVSGYAVRNGVYTYVCSIPLNNIASKFEFTVKSETSGVLCASKTVDFTFDALEDAFADPKHTAVDAYEGEGNAPASILGKGVWIRDVASFIFKVNASNGNKVVLKNVATNATQSVVIANNNMEVEFKVAAKDWDQEFVVYITDAEGNVISDAVHYSVAQYAYNKLSNDIDDGTLDAVLSAMMQMIAE